MPKISVTFDLNADGILNVSAKDNSTGRQEKITITNDKGRLSKADIDRMLSDAEKYREEDERQKEKITARNSLESYIFGCKQAVEDCQSGAITDSDKQVVRDKCASAMSWLDANNLAEKDEFEHQLKGNRLIRPHFLLLCYPIQFNSFFFNLHLFHDKNCNKSADPSWLKCTVLVMLPVANNRRHVKDQLVDQQSKKLTKAIFISIVIYYDSFMFP